MTEKRFLSEDDCYGYYTEIIDNEKELDLSLHNPKKNLTIEELVDLLNNLVEENKLLKKSVKKQQNSNNECAKLIVAQQKENERLKQDNQRLIKTLDNAANYMQKEHREIPLDDFVEWWNNIVTEGFE